VRPHLNLSGHLIMAKQESQVWSVGQDIPDSYQIRQVLTKLFGTFFANTLTQPLKINLDATLLQKRRVVHLASQLLPSGNTRFASGESVLYKLDV